MPAAKKAAATKKAAPAAKKAAPPPAPAKKTATKKVTETKAPPPPPPAAPVRKLAPWEVGGPLDPASPNYGGAQATPPPPGVRGQMEVPPQPVATAAAATMTPEEAFALLWERETLVKTIADTMKPLVEKEMIMRRKLVAYFFPDPQEGTNSKDLPDGWKLKFVNNIERKVDEAQLQPTLAQLPPDCPPLITWKPFVDTKAYKAVSKEIRDVFDGCVSSKPASPDLKLVPPKEGE